MRSYKNYPYKGIMLLLSLMLMMSMSAAAYARTAQEVFSNAQQLFKKGEYGQALKGFKHAQAMGISGPAIEYNLGVTQYKLKDYRQAGQHFSNLLHDKGMRALAAYNLGLINQKLAQDKAAIEYYRIAYHEASDRKLQTLAWNALRRMGIKLGRPFKPGVDSIVGLLYGSDSNVIDPVNPASNITDSFTELYAGMFYRMTPGLRLNGFYLNQDYSIANNYDFQLLTMSLDKRFELGPWKDSIGILTTTTTLGGKAYEDSVGAKLTGKFAMSDTHDMSIQYRFEQISAPTIMSYLQGSRQKIRIERVDHHNYGNRLMYEMEINARANSPTFSYSPTRHTLRYIRNWRLSRNWRLGGYVGYRSSTYTPVAGTTRQDQRMRIKAKVQRYFGKHWRFVAEYSYGNNHSNVAAYSYTRNLYDLGFKAFY